MLLFSFFFEQEARGEKPILNETVPLPYDEGAYRVIRHQGEWSLDLLDPQDKLSTQINLSNCWFCASGPSEDGDLDSCAGDGIFPISIGQKSYIGVSCHVGVHSHQVLLYSTPDGALAFKAYGDYFTELVLFPDAIQVHYDRRISYDNMEMRQKTFPNESYRDNSALSEAKGKATVRGDRVPLRIAPRQDAPILSWIKKGEILDLYANANNLNSQWHFVSSKKNIFGYVPSSHLDLVP